MISPLVSIITPCTRREFIGRAVLSVQAQTFQNFELIVVSDGGDNLESYLNTFSDRRIRYFYHEKCQGRSAARNTALQQTRGKYIAYLDDDDYYYPNHLETLVSFLEKSSYKVAYTDGYQTFEIQENGGFQIYRRDLIYSNDFHLDKILVESIFPTLGLMHAKSCLDEEVGTFDEALPIHEDWDLWIRIVLKYPAYHIAQITYEYSTRRGGDNARLYWLGRVLSTYLVINHRYQQYCSLTAKQHQEARRSAWFSGAVNQLLFSSLDKLGDRDVPKTILQIIERSYILGCQASLEAARNLAETFISRVSDDSVAWLALAKSLRFLNEPIHALSAINQSISIEASPQNLAEEIWILRILENYSLADAKVYSFISQYPADALESEFPIPLNSKYRSLSISVQDFTQDIEFSVELPPQSNVINLQKRYRNYFVWQRDQQLREIVDYLEIFNHLYKLVVIDFNLLKPSQISGFSIDDFYIDVNVLKLLEYFINLGLPVKLLVSSHTDESAWEEILKRYYSKLDSKGVSIHQTTLSGDLLEILESCIKNPVNQSIQLQEAVYLTSQALPPQHPIKSKLKIFSIYSLTANSNKILQLESFHSTLEADSYYNSLRLAAVRLNGHLWKNREFHGFGSFVLGPILTGFTEFCLDEILNISIPTKVVLPAFQSSLLFDLLTQANTYLGHGIDISVFDSSIDFQTSHEDSSSPDETKYVVICWNEKNWYEDFPQSLKNSHNTLILSFESFEHDEEEFDSTLKCYSSCLELSQKNLDSFKTSPIFKFLSENEPEFSSFSNCIVSPDLDLLSSLWEGIFTFQSVYLETAKLGLEKSMTYQKDVNTILKRLLNTSLSIENFDWVRGATSTETMTEKSLGGDVKLLIVTTDPGVGGVSQYNHAVITALCKRNFEVNSLLPRPVDISLVQNSINVEQDLGVNHYWLNAEVPQDVADLLSEIQPDLIIFSNTNPFANLAIKEAAIHQKIPFLIVEGLVESVPNLETSAYLGYLYRHYQEAKTVIAVSQHNLALLHQHFQLPLHKGCVIYYGRPQGYFQPIDVQKRQDLRKRLNIPSDAVVCFTSARIEPRKGYQYQLQAIRQLQQMPVWNHLYFVWAGGGIFAPDLERDLKSQVRKLNIEDRVKFLGQIASVAEWLDIADIFVLPSKAEGMPICVMEAMAKGLPVIASAVSGIPEELGDTGQLIPDPTVDPEATVSQLVETIQAWVSDPSLRQAIGQRCQERAKSLFTEERMIRETLMEIERCLLPEGDYVSPGLELIKPDDCFPNMIVGNPATCQWPYLRRQVPHNWYVDQRRPIVGFLSRDEAHILYNTALKFKGQRALEIGCWLGWSACHLALAGVELDVVDPLLESADFYDSVSDSLNRAGVLNSVNLVPGYSPQAVEALAKQHQRRWSLLFIDGNHDAPGPLQDAIACAPLAEPDAMILFHDLASPDVAQGLDYLRDQGWQTMVYQTMQIMGVAWRGNVEPVHHQPDPQVKWTLPVHLQSYPVSGMETGSTPLGDRHNQTPKILIDGVFFQLYKTGIARVWRSLLEEWATTDFAQHLVVLDRAGTCPKVPGLRYRLIPAYSYSRVEDDRQLLQQLCDEEGADLFISSYYTTPLTTPSVFMAYDMIPEIASAANGDQTLQEPMWQEKHRSIQQAAAHICISENTALDLLNFFPEIDPDFVAVAHCGVANLFTPATPEEISDFHFKYGIQKPYFLLVGVDVGYKNSILFYRSLAKLQSRHGYDIVSVGFKDTFEKEFRAYTAGMTVHVLQLSDEELRLAYSGAVALVYPSRYEGFGMPIVEAMACGCPVITCANGSIPEVAGDSALYVNDSDVDEMADALYEIQKPSVRRSLITSGLEQAKQFSWTKMAEIMATCLIETTLMPLDLRSTNLIICPDWSQPEEIIAPGLATVLVNLAKHDDRTQITLLVDTTGIGGEAADLLLSGITMQLALEADIDVTDGLQISLLENLGALQWQALLPKLQARVPLEHENRETIAAQVTTLWPVE